MFTKALEKIAELLIDKINATRFGGLVLICFAVIGGAFFVISTFRTSPATMETLRDPRFLRVCIIAVAITAGYMVSRAPVLRWSWRSLFLILIVAASAYVWGRYTIDNSGEFRIDVVLDGNEWPRSSIAKWFTDVQQPHIKVTLLYRTFVVQSTSDPVVFEDVLLQAIPRLRSLEEATNTVFVTNRGLTGSGLNNLFYDAAPRIAVVSTFGIAPSDSGDSPTLLRKYLATIIPLAAFHSRAQSEGKVLLRDRSPATEHNCLLDFSADRRLFIEELRLGPTMCIEEQSLIAAAFGDTVVSEYAAILSKVRTGNGHEHDIAQ